jgi:cell division transport system permease protein
MRALSIIAVAVLLLGGLSGCSHIQGEDSEEQKLEKLLDEEAEVSVFLKDDVTAQQKSDIEARLRALPDVKELVFETKAEAYEKFKRLWASESPEFVEKVSPDALPESFRVRLVDQAAVRRVRDTPVKAELEALPGVENLVFRCTTLEECKEDMAKQHSKPPG